MVHGNANEPLVQGTLLPSSPLSGSGLELSVYTSGGMARFLYNLTQPSLLSGSEADHIFYSWIDRAKRR